MQIAEVVIVQPLSRAIELRISGINPLNEFVERWRELGRESNAGDALNFVEPGISLSFVVLEVLLPRQRNFSGHFS